MTGDRKRLTIAALGAVALLSACSFGGPRIDPGHDGPALAQRITALPNARDVKVDVRRGNAPQDDGQPHIVVFLQSPAAISDTDLQTLFDETATGVATYYPTSAATNKWHALIYVTVGATTRQATSDSIGIDPESLTLGLIRSHYHV